MSSVPISDRASPTHVFSLEGGPSASVFVGLGMGLVVEGVAFHFWFASYSQLLAWTFTTLNVIVLASLWRSYKAMSTSALTVGEHDVTVTLGNQMRIQVDRSSILSVDPATWRSVPDPPKDYVNAAKPLEPNVLVVLREPARAKLPFGLTRRFTRLGVRVGDPARLIADLRGDSS